MELICKYKENKFFEKKLRERYSEDISGIIIKWLECDLFYIMKETSNKNIFILGKINEFSGDIKYTEKRYTIEDVMCRLIYEMDYTINCLRDI